MGSVSHGPAALPRQHLGRNRPPPPVLIPLDLQRATSQPAIMVEPVSLNHYREDQLWAVIASIGRTTRVAAVFNSRLAALSDREWREQQVKDYATFLRNSRQPAP